MSNLHEPVMLREVLEVLDPKPNSLVLDGTLGHGGHGLALALRISPGGTLIGLDRDPTMMEVARERLGEALASADVATKLVVSSYDRADEVLASLGYAEGADVILLDVGVNSWHLDDGSRGFSFSKDGPLDGRFNPEEGGVTMADFVNSASEAELARVFRDYGDERLARPIARRIVQRRQTTPFSSTLDLAYIAAAVYPPKARYTGINPATRIFQALRIQVNDELETLRRGIEVCLKALAPGGRLGVLSFHSGEHRVVKSIFRAVSDPKPDPSNPFSATSTEGVMYKQLFRKAMSCSDEEAAKNPRARSTQFRAIERLPLTEVDHA